MYVDYRFQYSDMLKPNEMKAFCTNTITIRELILTIYITFTLI